METIKKPYEISIWEDKLVHGKSEDSQDSYFDEVKIAVIGSDSMTAPWRAVNPSFVTNVNGSHTLTFTMYTKYYDDTTDELADNPFTKLMVNERKVKLKYDGEWYDFIIKNIQENSEQHSYAYTAKDLAINELSKNGFALVLDEELNNNVGTVVELAEKILEGTDWQVSRENSETIRQLTEEPLYEVTLSEDIRVINILNPTEPANLKAETDAEKFVIKAGNKIYVFYSCYINNEDTSFFQILYNPSGEYKTDDDRLIIDSEKWNWRITSSITYITTTTENGEIKDLNPNMCHYNFETLDAKGQPTTRVTEKYRGEKLVRSVETFYDKVLDRYVTVYLKKTDGEPDVCGYSKSEYLVDEVVVNYVDNGRDFTSFEGDWVAEASIDAKNQFSSSLSIVTDPVIEGLDISSGLENIKITSYLNWDCDKNTARPKLLANCITSNRTAIHEFSVGGEIEGTDIGPDKYIFLARVAKSSKGDNKTTYTVYGDGGKNAEFPFDVLISEYHRDFLTNKMDFVDKDGNPVDPYFKQTGIACVDPYDIEKWYIKIELTCQKSATFQDLLDKRIGLFLIPNVNFPEGGFFIEDIQLFKEVTNENGLIYPVTEDTPRDPENPLVGAKIREQYFYYHYNPEITDEALIEYIYKGYEKQNFQTQYNENCEKKRSIKASESNRFNLLQELCETFECWIEFKIEHDPDTGKIKMDEPWSEQDENGEKRWHYRQKKSVAFKNYIGRDNYAGFRYGINLKSINRTIDSEAIVSKLIVKPNSNQYASGGFCTIATSSENESGEAFILDFSHYYTQSLLNISEVTNDLYVPAMGIGYITRLKRLNKNVADDIKTQTSLVGSTIPNLQSQYTAYQGLAEGAAEKVQEFLRKFQNTVGDTPTFAEFLAHKENEWWASQDVVALAQSIVFMQNKCLQYEKLRDVYNADLEAAKAQLTAISEKLEDVTKQKEAINQEFYEKYARFIQEGSWISEDYVDDNLYYLDAESTLHTSSQPKVTYNISVVEVSELEGLEPYNFRVGDKTYIEDTEFFGYTYKESGGGTYKTPYHEEVVVTEVKFQLDAPEQNSITVQNYKTQFEDLFQRITATTTSVQFSTGDYQRAASAIEQDGTINVDVLQNSLFNNSIILQNSNNNSVVWDESGITTIDLNSPNKIVRIVGGGIFLSTDYGSTWSTGITGDGINADCITSGQIDTSVIRLMDGLNPTFRWDKNGITAYNVKYKVAENGNITDEVIGYSQNNFVRFDQYGVYAIDGVVDNPDGQEAGDGGFRAARPIEVVDESTKMPIIVSDEEKIAYFSRFYLTRKGFGLRTDNGSVRITNDREFQVLDSDMNERIHMGYLGVGDSSKSASITFYLVTDEENKTHYSFSWPVLGVSEEGTFSISGEEITLKANETSSEEDNGIRAIIKKDINEFVYNVLGQLDKAFNCSNAEFEQIKQLGAASENINTVIISASTLGRYGMELKNELGVTTLMTDDGGALYLKDRLYIGPTAYNPRVILGASEFYYDTNEEKGHVRGDIATREDADYSKIFSVKNLGNVETIAFYDDGRLEANDVVLKGIIEATGGQIGNVTIEQVDQLGMSFAKLIFNEDGLSVYDGGIRIYGYSTINNYEFATRTTEEQEKEYYLSLSEEQYNNLSSYSEYNKDKDGYELRQYKIGKEENEQTFYEVIVTKKGSEGQEPSEEEIQDTLNLIKDRLKEIYKDNPETVLEATENGDLIITGTINALNGYFSGELRAPTGNIGGLEIIDKNLICYDSNGNILYGLYGNYENEEGYIQANSIHIGTKAVIDDYLAFGNARLYNPIPPNNDREPGLFLEAGAIKLYEAGVMKLGGLTFDNNSLSIYAGEWPNCFWEIGENTAYFRNVQVSGRLSTVVFDASKITASGGTTIFKDSARIESIDIENNSIIIEAEQFNIKDSTNIETVFPVNYYVALTSENTSSVDNPEGNITIYARIKSTVLSEDGQKITITFKNCSESLNKDLKLFFILGEKEDWIVSANSKNVVGPMGIQPNSISISSFEDSTEYSANEESKETTDELDKKVDLNFTTQIVLGAINEKLLGADENAPDTYVGGLYANSVYLTGTLTTKYISKEESEYLYAGVNTINGATFAKDETGKDTSPIIFWAGAYGPSEEAIREAPFQVTSNGYLYAANGLFTGTVMTDSLIANSTLKAAKIYGIGGADKVGNTQSGAENILEAQAKEEEIEAALGIYDCGLGGADGIEFFKIASTENITEDNVEEANYNRILSIVGEGITFYQDEKKGKEVLVISKDAIDFKDNFLINNYGFKWNNNLKLVADIGESNLQSNYITFKQSEISILEIGSEKVTSYKDFSISKSNLIFDGSNVNVTYREATNVSGYDIYVKGN